MKSIALIHTVESVAVSFGHELQNFLPEKVKIHNIWDDYLATNPNEIGNFTINNRNRLLNIVKNCEMTGADLIVTTCSTLTPIIKMIRPFIKTKIISIDDAIIKRALTLGNNILILATAPSAAAATKIKLVEDNISNKSISIHVQTITEAFECLKNMDITKHDQIIKEKVTTIKNIDCIILAQASMAHLEKDIANLTKCTVLSSPVLCMEEIKEYLFAKY